MKNILLIQTGGTIAMDITPGSGPHLDAEVANKAIYQKIPELSEIAQIDTIRPFFEDSSDVNHRHWTKLIECIARRYNQYDGFVILHGTDTMAYTASALSFGLQQLSKPIIFTGSQVPMASLRSDARRNLVNAVEMATLPMPEVGICFNDFVYRGNRSAKMSIGDFDAFASPNYPPLAKIGLNIELNKHYIKQASGDGLKYSTSFSDAVYLLKIYTGLPAAFLTSIDLSSVRVIIVEAFGSVNFPMNDESGLPAFFESCIENGILLVITSQAPYDAVDLTKYESGRAAAKLGAVSAGDMTTEATLTKIMYLLEKCSNDDELKTRIQTNISGELTE
jgi:L-asparaginase